MLTPIIFKYLSIAKRKKFLIFFEIQYTRKVRFCTSKSIKDRTFFFFQLIDNQKIVEFTVPMIDLGKGKKSKLF